MDRIANYLSIPQEYGQGLGGLRWSASGDAVEYREAETFALGAQIALFLEGFATRPSPRLIHFAHLLHLLQLLGLGRGPGAPGPREAVPMAGAFRETRGSLRNAGAFCAVLCRGVPAVADQPDTKQICLWLRGVLHYFPQPHPNEAGDCEQPAWSPAQFEAHVLAGLREYTLEELVHWFRHGRGRIPEAGQQIAQELLAPRPRTAAEVLAEATKRARLVGAAPYVAQLVSALTLPPRRLEHEELAVGGFADVTTRGHPEHLLPSQFALDSLEFIRRYAERELLFFRREEPHTRIREELVVLLDQGVRTWGDVRLILTAAVLAFARLATRRGVKFRLAMTSGGGQVLDVLEMPAPQLGAALEVSDLSPHPALPLERVLTDLGRPDVDTSVLACATQARTLVPTTHSDVVLLTHPRSLAEAEVGAAARRTPPGQRLFAVCVDDAGNAQLNELRHGAALRLRSFRVDPGLTQAPKPAAAAGLAEGLWQGDVEKGIDSVGFSRIRFIDFDAAGEWLLAATAHDGHLIAWHLADGRLERWPRGQGAGLPSNRPPLTHVEAVMGVPRGFVVAGISDEGWPVLYHYDLTEHRCTRRSLPLPGGGLEKRHRRLWFYFGAWNAVVVRDVEDTYEHALDLATGETYVHKMDRPDGDVPRAVFACARSRICSRPNPELEIIDASQSPRPPRICVAFHHKACSIEILDPYAGPAFVPQSDGKPMLIGCTVTRAWRYAGTLALEYRRGGAATSPRLALFRLPDGVPFYEHIGFPKGGAVAISADGRRIAFQVGKRRIKIGTTDDGGGYYLLTFDAKRTRH